MQIIIKVGADEWGLVFGAPWLSLALRSNQTHFLDNRSIGV
jgi:hypothetical protein